MQKSFLNLNIKSSAWFSKNTKSVLNEAEEKVAAIVKLSREQKRAPFDALRSFNQISAIIGEARAQANFFAAVHSDPKVRKAAEKSVEECSRFSSRLYLRRDLYEAMKSVSESGLDEGAKRFRQKELLDFKLTGIEKPPAARRKIKKLMDKAVTLVQAFDRNIRDDIRYLDLSPADLEGLPEDYKKSHKPDKKGLVRISTQYPDYYPFMQYAKNSEARRKLSYLMHNRGCPKNEKVLRELLGTRRRQAKLVGYRDWANYVTADKMTGSAKTVHRFIDQLAKIVKAPSERDLKIFFDRKKKDQPEAKSLDIWDMTYYEDLAIKERIGLDTQKVRSYLPFNRVKQGILDTTARLFSLSYHRVSAPVWHKEIEAFNVYRGKKLLGRFYLDLHPRKGKFGHAACFDIRPGIRDVQLPEASLVCNFPKGLMTHGEVTTFLHEFGHLLHYILGGDQEWARFNGFGTEWDFVETPSQILESWALDYKTLKAFARHPKTGTAIPEELVKKMRKADAFGRSVWFRRQNFYSALSLGYHELSNLKHSDLFKIMLRIEKRYDIQRYPKNMHFYASFGHLGGYSAIYYTYMWSRAIAQDILSLFERKGMHNRATANRYVEQVLMPGGSKDANELIRNFLGRKWSLTSFRRWIEK